MERLHGDQIVKSMNGNVGYNPLIEQKDNQRSLPSFLQEDPRYVIGNGTFKKVPLLTGVTRDETANAIDIKNIEKIFSTPTKFLNSLTDSVKKNGLSVGNVIGKLLPGVGKKHKKKQCLEMCEIEIVAIVGILQEKYYHSLIIWKCPTN